MVTVSIISAKCFLISKFHNNIYKYLIPILLVLTTVFLSTSHSTEFRNDKDDLNGIVSYYEILDYNPIQIQQSHKRLRRWVQDKSNSEKDPEPSIELKFLAHSQNFHIRLKRDVNVFEQDFNVILGNHNSTQNENNLHLFVGEIVDTPGSVVYGSIKNGIFDGKVSFPDSGTFYVERSHKYSLPQRNASQHSVIYHESHVINTHGHLCGLNSSIIYNWMKNEQSDGNDASFDDNFDLERNHFQSMGNDSYSFSDELIHSRIRRNVHGNAKTSRETSRVSSINFKTTCPLHIRTDPKLWEYIAIQEATSDKAIIKEEILSIIGEHVKAANDIFSNARFIGEAFHQNIRFSVRTVKIDTTDECDEANGITEPNHFCADYIDVTNFLDIHSRTNHDDFCLSYVFTYRDFTGGVVGLAWVPSPGVPGGICERYSTFYSKGRSLNTGVVTFLNYNRRVPPKVSHLTFVHELGHNFGAPHDAEECAPGGLKGNYIMYSSATSGYLENNAKFSQCSLNSIGKALDRIFLQKSGNHQHCFVEAADAFCGNNIVEKGEECDCGYYLNECQDKCCNARQLDNTDRLNSAGCKRTASSRCSPTEGPCCQADTCNFTPSFKRKICRQETECYDTAICDGESPYCPESQFKPDTTLCNNGTQVCIEGECQGSVCLIYNLKQCYLSSSKFLDRSLLCSVACFDDATQECKSLSDLKLPNVPSYLKLPPGSPCDNFQGYCDVFSRCRIVDEKGPLLRIAKTLFNQSNFRNLKEWAIEYWYYCILIGIGIIVFMGLFIKCCAVHTPSSNPYLPEHIKFSETLRKPMNSLKRRPRNQQRGGVNDHELRNLNVPNQRGRRDGGSRRIDYYRSTRQSAFY